MQMCVYGIFSFFFQFSHLTPKSRKFLSKQHFLASKIIRNVFFPLVNRLSVASVGKSYETILEESAGFTNPQCIEHLSQSIGLDSSVFYTNMSGLRGKYPNEEYASDLRQSQASSWAFR